MPGAQVHLALLDLREGLLLHHISRYSPSPQHTWCAPERVEVHAHLSVAYVKEHSFDHSIMESHTLAWKGSVSTHPFSCLLPHARADLPLALPAIHRHSGLPILRRVLVPT